MPDGDGGPAPALRAVARGPRIDPWAPARGTVAHVYRGAVNVRLGSQLWSLVPQDMPDGPTTIRVAADDWSRTAAVAPGDPVVLRAAVLRAGPVLVDLRTATSWQPSPFPAPATGMQHRAAAVAQAALHRGAAPWIPSALTAALDAPARCVPQVVGRGIGLTPAGDDALVGALAVAAALGVPADDLRAAVLAAAPTTTELSAAFLRQACEGGFHRPLHEAVAALLGGTDDPAGTGLLDVGATSGADAALGAATALRRWARAPGLRPGDPLPIPIRRTPRAAA
jgi:hypothetical protein